MDERQPATDTAGHHVAILVALSACLFLTDLGGRDFWDIDEGVHAVIARTMLESGDWLTPVFNGETFLDKPPLFTWATAISFKLFGANEFAGRLPAALFGLGCVLLAYFTGRRIYSAQSGLLAGIVLATSLEFLMLSRAVQYDVPFAFFTTLVMYFYTRVLLDEERRQWCVRGMYVAAAFAVLTKGPLGAIVPAVAILGHLLVDRRMRLLWVLLDPLGIVLFFVLAGPWYVLMERANPGYLEYFVWRQHFANLFGDAAGYIARHREPLYFYIPVLILGMLPWSLQLPQAIGLAWRQRRETGRGVPMLFVAWVLGPLLILSAATSKLANYIMPLFPPAAVLLGHYWSVAIGRPARRPGLLFGVAVTAVVLVLLASYIFVEDPWSYWDFRLGIEWADFERFMLIFSGLFVAATALLTLSRLRAGFVVLASIAPVVTFYIIWVLAPGAADFKSSRQIAAEIDQLLPPGEPIHFHPRILDSAMFYADRDCVKLPSEDDLMRYLDSDERVYVVVYTRAHKREDAFQGDYEVVKQIGNKAIVSNRP